jgi:hypothetical protein
MSDTPIAIKVAGEDTQHRASAIGWTSDDETWVKELSASDKQVRIRLPADDSDTEGHALSTAVTVLVDEDDDDVEGHALNLHFPSVQEANDFRRQLIAAGLLTATIAVSAAGGAALGSALSSSAGFNNATVVSEQAAGQGQYNPANMGGTLPAAEQAAGQGQYNPANMGGTPQTPPVEEE